MNLKSSKGGMSIIIIVVAALLLMFGGKIFSVFSDLLASLGLGKDAEDKQVEDALENSQVGSPWNAATWKGRNGGRVPMSSAAAIAVVDKIWNSFGAFNDDEEGCIGAFKTLSSQSQCSYVVDQFYQKHQVDLLAWLPGGSAWSWPSDRLSNDDLATIVTYVKRLPL